MSGINPDMSVGVCLKTNLLTTIKQSKVISFTLLSDGMSFTFVLFTFMFIVGNYADTDYSLVLAYRNIRPGLDYANPLSAFWKYARDRFVHFLITRFRQQQSRSNRFRSLIATSPLISHIYP